MFTCPFSTLRNATLTLLLACVVHLVFGSEARAARALPSYDFSREPAGPSAYPRSAAKENERRAAITELLASADLSPIARASLQAQRANSALVVGDFSGAMADLLAAIKVAPSDAGLRTMLVRFLWIAGRDGDADKELQSSRKILGKRPQTRMLVGTIALGREDWKTAATELNMLWTTAENNDPEPYAALLAHVATARQSGATSRLAVDPLRHVVGTDRWPRPVADALLGTIDAVALEKLAVHPDPHTERSWQTDVDYFLGERAALEGREDEATTRFQRVLALGVTQKNEYHLARARLLRSGATLDAASAAIDEQAPSSSTGAAPADDNPPGNEEAAFDREINRLVRSGAVKLAIGRLRERKVDEMNEDRMRMFASLLLRTGQVDEGVAALRASLSGDSSDAPVFATIGWAELVAALEQGVTGKRSGVARVFSAAFDPRGAKNRKEGEKRLESARDAFERARLMRPDDVELARTNASVMEFVGQSKGALVIWRHQLELNPTDDEAALGVARCLVATGEFGPASRNLAPVLARHPHHSAAHAIMSEISRKKRDTRTAIQHEDHAKFGSQVPPGSQLPFNRENLATLEKIQVTPGQYMGIHFVHVATSREATVRAWIADRNSATATAFLAAALWVPEPDMDKTLRIARELHERGETATLRTIFEETDNIVTAGAAARVLAEAGHKDIFDRLQTLLQSDDELGITGDIASALAASRDIRATQPLVGMLDPGFEPSPRLVIDRVGPIAGYTAARARAALALSSFDTDFAQGALETGIQTPEIALHCHAALFVMTKQRQHLDAIRSALRYSWFLEAERTFATLEQTGDPEVAEIAAAYRARKRREE